MPMLRMLRSVRSIVDIVTVVQLYEVAELQEARSMVVGSSMAEAAELVRRRGHSSAFRLQDDHLILIPLKAINMPR